MGKGFGHRGVGPVGICQARDSKKAAKRLTDALGGHAMVNAFTAVSAPLTVPLQFHGGNQGHNLPGKAFAFLGIGALVQDPCRSARALILGLRSGVRASAGLGLGVPLPGMGTLELTLAYPF